MEEGGNPPNHLCNVSENPPRFYSSCQNNISPRAAPVFDAPSSSSQVTRLQWRCHDVAELAGALRRGAGAVVQFRLGEEHLQASSSSGSGLGGGGLGSTSGDLGEENERLHQENARLTRELGHTKKLCNNILLLMSKYAATQQRETNAALSSVANCSGESSEALPPPLPLPPEILDLIPSCSVLATAAVAAGLVVDGEQPDTSARLFGVSIGLKRMREDGDNASGTKEDPADDHGVEVKPEPADPRPDSKEQSPDQHPCSPGSKTKGHRRRVLRVG